jgi:16S rRNA (adenine1518-N6/adenine1519-N6)-dimethyltransferase
MFVSKAKKRLGQHFLTDRRIAARIVNSVDPQPGEQIVEIGPGKGALTGLLLKKGCVLTTVEFDRELIPFLKKKYSGFENLKIIAQDFLKLTADEMPAKMKIIGNIPYNITTAILEKLFDFKDKILQAVLTIQSEVAQRLTASPGTKQYGSFTVIMAAGFDIKALFHIPPSAFKPAPAVYSTVIKIVPVNHQPKDFENFKSFIRGCFKQKRKTLCNSMQLGLNIPKNSSEALISALGKEKNIRPEQLTFDDYLSLYNRWLDSK